MIEKYVSKKGVDYRSSYLEYSSKNKELLPDSKLLCNTIECGWP